MPDAAIIEFLFYGPLNAWELIVRVDSCGCSFVGTIDRYSLTSVVKGCSSSK